MEKVAPAAHPIHPLIAQRWSPRSFSSTPVAPEVLAQVLEAARWAASCYNDQPWIFIVARREQPQLYQKALACLVPFNQAWAQSAPVLMIALAQKTFKHNGKPNDWHEYDLGQAVATLCLQATALGLQVHQMAGFEPETVIRTFHVPDHVVPKVMIALGYPGDPAHLPEDLRERELAPRSRYPLSSFVYGETWGSPAEFVE
ncbi:MAG: nitroreductase family protein [Thermostichales cyanobacterium SZTDM-1c_bins_54]